MNYIPPERFNYPPPIGESDFLLGQVQSIRKVVAAVATEGGTRVYLEEDGEGIPLTKINGPRLKNRVHYSVTRKRWILA